VKRSLIITIGVVLILLVLGVWLYLLFFGTPGSSDDVFTNLGIGIVEEAQPAAEPAPPQKEPQTQVDTSSGGLQQLTTRPVAGFGFVGTSTTLLRYAERGTGHIYELDIASGAERRVSGTTIPQVVDVAFSPNGAGVALISEDGQSRTVLVGTTSPDRTTNANYVTLPNNVFDVAFNSNTTLHYAAAEGAGTAGYAYDITTRDPLRLFSLPLKDVRMVWGDTPYLYNSPTRHFQGSLYRSEDLTAVTSGEYGFVANMNERYVFASRIEDEQYVSYAQHRHTGERTLLPLTFVPEKCTSVASNPDILWCASPIEGQDRNYIEDWYKGVIWSEDVLWRVNIPTGGAQLVSNLFDEAGRLIDVGQMRINETGTIALFGNVVDNTLWMYDTRTE